LHTTTPEKFPRWNNLPPWKPNSREHLPTEKLTPPKGVLAFSEKEGTYNTLMRRIAKQNSKHSNTFSLNMFWGLWFFHIFPDSHQRYIGFELYEEKKISKKSFLILVYFKFLNILVGSPIQKIIHTMLLCFLKAIAPVLSKIILCSPKVIPIIGVKCTKS